ncbi:LamG-like jellyroll fold domain-containing protein [Roseimaritima sediminicola]|uniref:LamG-like jellyroll fold domain-containing protein n=1 Tax=Roseimaritima sediminicola TaxID=2662066 RepID=UPI0012983CEE|nr:LamG-like jellyroll fold domain-containing protein [Roseimaritima sediminicola]
MRYLAVFLVPLCLLGVGSVATAHPPTAADNASADHDHDHGHDHPHPPGEAPFTTRVQARVLPLAKQEDVFHFVVYGDRTGGPPEGLRVLEQAVRDTNLLDPDLVMTVGDLIQGYNTSEEWLPQMKAYKAVMNGLNMRWFPVAGNHDVYWRGPGPAPEGQHESNYEKHFGPLWYSFRHKNAGFIVLYSDEGDPATNQKGFNSGKLQTMSDEQLEFLQQALEQLADQQHVFVFLHHPRWIGRGYAGGNWDVVHEKLKAAGNVSAVFAGHIHRMRFDGAKDGIAYYTLATTGGHLSAEIPDAGYLHHLNLVTVRPDSYSVSALPIGAVIDPKEFTPEFREQIAKARSIVPTETANDLMLNLDGSVSGQTILQLHNPCERRVEGTLSLAAGRNWSSSLDHYHFEIEPGQAITVPVQVRRQAIDSRDVSLPRVRVDLEYVGQSARIRLPETETPLGLQLAGVPADYFSAEVNQCLRVDGDASAVRVPSKGLKIPTGPLTLEAWVRPSDLTGNRAIVAKTQQSEFAIFMNEGVPKFDIHVGGSYVSAAAGAPLVKDRWTHLAGVFDGQQVAFYVDGKQVATTPAKGKRRTNDLPLYVGADPDGGGQPTRSFAGAIDEVRLSAAAVYSGDFEPARRLAPQSDTRLLLHLNRSIGPFVLDHSSTAHHGLLGRGATLVPVAE